MTLLALTPSRRAITKSSAAARIAVPVAVRVRKSASPATSTTAAPIETRSTIATRVPKIVTGSDRPPAKSTPLARRPQMITATLWIRMLTANEVTSSVVGSALRTGRNAIRSISSAASATAATTMITISGQGSAAVRKIVKPPTITSSP